MEPRRLGASDLAITPIGLGTWALGGGDWVLGWGPQDDRQSMATIRRAVDRGINWIDTAPVFGLGHAEEIVARALRGIPPGRRPYVFVRCGLVWDELGNVSHDLSPASLRVQLEGSLRRLRRERIDLYQVGWPRWPTSPRGDVSASLDRAWETLAALQHEGKIGWLGISGCGPSRLARLQAIAPVTSISAPCSLLRQEAARGAGNLDATRGAGMIACSTLAAGLLTGTMTEARMAALPHNDWRRRHPFFREMALTRAATIAERLRRVASARGVTPAAAALAWALGHPRITAAVVGARRPGQVDDLVAAAPLELNDDEIRELTGVAWRAPMPRRGAEAPTPSS